MAAPKEGWARHRGSLPEPSAGHSFSTSRRLRPPAAAWPAAAPPPAPPLPLQRRPPSCWRRSCWGRQWAGRAPRLQAAGRPCPRTGWRRLGRCWWPPAAAARRALRPARRRAGSRAATRGRRPPRWQMASATPCRHCSGGQRAGGDVRASGGDPSLAQRAAGPGAAGQAGSGPHLECASVLCARWPACSRKYSFGLLPVGQNSCSAPTYA